MENHTMMMPRMMILKNTIRTLLLTALVLAPAPLALANETLEDRWYVVELMEQRTGWMNVLVEQADNGDITTSTALSLKINRGQITLPIEMSGVFVETDEGEPVSMRGTQRMGQTPIESSWVFTNGKTGKVKATSTQFGNATTSEIDPPTEQWMTPHAASKYIERQLDAGKDTIVTSTVDPAMGLVVVETTASVVGETVVEALGRSVPAVEWVAFTSAAPGVKATEYVNKEGEPIRTEIGFGGINMTIILADKQLALSKLDPAEIMVSTFVTPDRPISNPRQTSRARYRLTLTDGATLDLDETGSQTWSRQGDAIVLDVTADPSKYSAARVRDIKPYLASTPTADFEDSEIKAMLAHALTGAENRSDVKKAELLRRFVYSFINHKSLGVGFASASEVARTKQGDCSEHGVLLTTLLRGAGIPSRVASGLIYAESFEGAQDIFGYHMWSQALLEIDGVMRWVDLDATLPDQTPFDATHITVATSDLSDRQAINSMAGLAPMLGKLEIEVVSIR